MRGMKATEEGIALRGMKVTEEGIVLRGMIRVPTFTIGVHDLNWLVLDRVKTQWPAESWPTEA
jgi:hypothetical protein